jgi:hypothetical protein
VTFGPVVSGSRLPKDKVILGVLKRPDAYRAEKLTKWSGSHTVHRSGLEINEDGSGDVFAAGGLWVSGHPGRYLVIVDIDALKLQVAVSVIGT